MTTLVFKLSMPNRNSWNGGWSGEDREYNIVKNFGRSKKAKDKAEKLLEKESFYYNFGDGWGASVSVRQVDAAGARKARKLSDGFCGYDWMVSSIVSHGEIRA
jgi:hypothetical protein